MRGWRNDTGGTYRAALMAPLAIILVLLAPDPLVRQAAAHDPATIEFFEKKIRPLLVANCYNCHSANTNSQGGLRVDDRNGLISGGNSGPAIVPGDVEKSRLIQAVRYSDEDLKMPPNKQLSEEEVADFAKWIADGAAWPEVRLPASINEPNAEYDRLRATHWAWQPLQNVAAPPVKNAAWARDDIDRFLLAKLEDQGLLPVADARRITLLRRVTFDLTGLPPRPDEIDAFVEDESPTAFENVVDRLLVSPAFGERWGRHWLDVARYGESTGSARNLPYPHAWRYRDWVIDSIHNDKPYDQFLREQIAGDLLPANSPREKAEQLVATGFLALGVKDVNQRYKVRYVMDNVDEQIDTVTRAVLGLTVSCARCHDHKFDPIPATDYYALAGIFRSTELCAGLRNKMGGGGLDYYDTQMLIPLGFDPPAPQVVEKIDQARRALEMARADFQSLRTSPEGNEKSPDGRPKRAIAREKVAKLQAELVALTDPAVNGPVALGVRESAAIGDTEIRIRGEAEKLGPLVHRGFLHVLELPGQPPVNPRQSGRLELAWWLTSENNPLTPRVMANRVWQHLFGQGLVTSVDNFGVTGDQPSHPELLDHLAARLIRGGWSIKKLVRSIVLTRAYQLAADAPEKNMSVDPASRLVWRHSPRRLDAEEIRDAMLAAAGRLDRSRPEASPARDFKVIELRDNGPEAQKLADQARASVKRSVYLPLLRGLTPRALEVFDFAEQGMVTGRRDATTVAPQALFLLNDPFVRQQSEATTERLFQRADLDETGKIHWAYRVALGRTATPVELTRAQRYLSEYEGSAREMISAAAAAAAKAQAPPPTEAAKTGSGDDGAAVKKPAAASTNPDDPVPGQDSTDEQPKLPADPKVAAWASFCQALLSSAEFRYLK